MISVIATATTCLIAYWAVATIVAASCLFLIQRGVLERGVGTQASSIRSPSPPIRIGRRSRGSVVRIDPPREGGPW